MPASDGADTIPRMVIDNPVRSRLSDDVERSPRAARIGRPRWSNPQVIIGVVLVLGATALGARLFAAADDTVPVLVAATDLRPGQPLTDASVEVRHVRLDDTGDHYHSGDVGTGYVVVRPVDRGELLPASAVSAVDADPAADVRYLSLSLPSEEVPRSLATGSSVDVWLTPADDSEKRDARLIAQEVTVSGADGDAGALGIEGSRTSVTLAVRRDQVDGAATDADRLDDLVATLVGAARDGRVYLVLRPDPAAAP